MTPRVVDNDRDEITVTLDGREIRGWSYASEAERRTKMLAAREFCEGWHQASEACRPVSEAMTELLEANSYYFPPGNPWGDKARAVLQKAGG